MFRSKVVKLAAFGFFSVLMSASLISFLILTSNTVSADDSIVSDVSISVPVSCSVTGTLDTAHTATVNNGTYQEDIGTTTFKVVCNDNSGYSIYAVGYSNEEFGNTKMLATIGGVLTPASDFNTGLATSGNTSAWAMKIIPLTTVSSGTTQPYTPTIESDTNGSFSNYHIVPSTYTKVATFASSTDFTIGSSIQSTYRAFISSNQLAGNYNGKVRYTLVHPASEVPTQPVACNSGKICYNPNANGVADSMGDQNIASSVTTANLWATNFRRDGYGFAGWSDKFDWVINENDANGNGTGPNAGYHIYGPNATISFAAGQYTGLNPGLSLYAVWVPTSGDLQTFTCPDNSTMPIGNITALRDQRDNNAYTVAKLADGKCWMTENLRLDNTAAHNSDGTLAQGYNSSFIGLADSETTNFADSTTANSLYSTDGSTIAPTITGNHTSKRFPRYNNQNTSNPATNMTAWNDGSNTYSLGNYYTWAAAVADTSYYHNGDDNRSITTTICPFGWHLPKGGDNQNTANNEFLAFTEALIGAKPANYNSSFYPYYTGNPEGDNASAKLRSYPNNFVYSGNFRDSSASYRSSEGYYWSSTVGNITMSYGLHLISSYVYPGTEGGNYKYHGLSIRCVR